ncbi:DUF2335 domain-containing protein [uncultured Sphingomonas sp.]|uniref:DUF2335 domain-containing protein n=1 Tax=uncultured Sphingomonas sp. TaxID=158754 RepID=UPI0035CB3ED1
MALERLTPLVAAENMSQVGAIVAETITEITTHHSGPLPRARDLAEYKQVDASFAERIVRMAEKEQDHLHAVEMTVIERDHRLKSRGQQFALAAAFMILLFAAYLAFTGNTDMAGKVAIGTLIGVVGIFVSGRVVDAVAERGREED